MKPTPLSTDSIPTMQTPLDTRGRGLAAIVYILFLGSIMAVVTAPIGVLMAHLRRRYTADWVASHLQFQIRTFWLGALGGVAALAIWNLLGLVSAPSWASWVLGYAFFTACLIWTIGRCGVGINRLLHDLPIDDPRSLLFGGARVSLED